MMNEPGALMSSQNTVAGVRGHFSRQRLTSRVRRSSSGYAARPGFRCHQ